MDRATTKKVVVFVIGYSTASGTRLVVRQLIKQILDTTGSSRYQRLMIGIGTIAISSFAAGHVSRHAKKSVEELFDLYDEHLPAKKTS